MSVYRNPELIKSFVENDLQNIQQSLDQMGPKSQKVSHILDDKYRYSNEKFEHRLDIGDLFENVHFQSMGFDTSSRVIEELNHYQSLLKKSFTVCRDHLPPLFANAFQCYWRAAQSGATGEGRGSFISAMQESGKIAKEIATQYKALETAFVLARNRIMEMAPRLHTHRLKVSFKMDPEKNPLAQRMIASLDSALKSTFQMGSYLLDARALFNKANLHIGHFPQDTSILTEPDFLDEISATPPKESTPVEEVKRLLQTRPMALVSIFSLILPPEVLHVSKKPIESQEHVPVGSRSKQQPAPSPQFHPNQCALEIKMERPLPSPPPSRSPLTQRIKSMHTDVEETFEDSFLEWVAAAKINQETVASLRRIILTIEMTQQKILTIEKDSLVIALHATSS